MYHFQNHPCVCLLMDVWNETCAFVSRTPVFLHCSDEGITALHNGICAGHAEVVRFLVEFGCDVNAQDSDGW